MCVEWMRICGEMSDMDVCGVDEKETKTSSGVG